MSENKAWAQGTQRVGDVQINEDLDFQRHLFAFQRVGLVVMATVAVVVAALLGLFGGGDYSPRRRPVTKLGGGVHAGVERLDQIKYAVLERNGSVSIIPKAGVEPENSYLG